MIVAAEVAMVIKETILGMFGSIMTAMIELFYERYVVVTEVVVVTAIVAVVATRPHEGDLMLYREFNNKKPPD